MRFLSSILYSIGKASLDRKQSKKPYIPPSEDFGGEWVNKGNDIDEHWVWIDKRKKDGPYYVSVLKSGKGYTLIVDPTPVEFSLDVFECEDTEQVDTVVEMLTAGYGTQGKVTVNSCLTEKNSCSSP